MVGANLDGRVTTAAFGWSASPCSSAAKIKLFRPAGSPSSQPPFTFVTERGPFDVAALPATGYWGTQFPPFATQTVTLSPPIELRAGDLVAITNLTTCGGPIRSTWPFASPPPGNFNSFTVPGDVTSTIISGRYGGFASSVFLTASGTSSALGLLNDRFLVTMTARDPRTGATASGVPNLLGLGGKAGYFSLPAFTGDSTFPEVTVKMVDATGVPALGGTFWFFHTPLTDVQYTLTVRDKFTGAVKNYSNIPGSPGQLCGGADTSAFPGP